MNNKEILKVIGRSQPLLDDDIHASSDSLAEIISASRFLVIGAAGSIGAAVTKEIFKRNPRVLHAVDISENNMVELVRDIRSTFGYIQGDFRTFSLDCASREYQAFLEAEGQYDYVLNLSALKHVRSEKDPFTIMRMIQVNILNTIQTIQESHQRGAKKYFCVSTDKAANPVNMMGASKRIMELFLMRESQNINISTARFANVAFSDGSLLHGFNQRFMKKQPISAPNDVRRYFVTPQESGELCLASCLLGENRDIFFPKLNEDLHLTHFSSIARRYVEEKGFEPFECSSEDEARAKAEELIAKRKYPCYFFASDTTGEKDFEEFFIKGEKIDLKRFENIGIVKNRLDYCDESLDEFLVKIEEMKARKLWDKQMPLDLFKKLLPNFEHKEAGKNLDQKM